MIEVYHIADARERNKLGGYAVLCGARGCAPGPPVSFDFSDWLRECWRDYLCDVCVLQAFAIGVPLVFLDDEKYERYYHEPVPR